MANSGQGPAEVPSASNIEVTKIPKHSNGPKSGQVDGKPATDVVNPGSETKDNKLSTIDTVSDDQTEMPSGSKKGVQPPRREADFSTLLTVTEKNELISLTSKISDNMQRQLNSIFESPGVNSSDIPPRSSFWEGLPARLRDFSVAVSPHQSTSRQKNGQNRSREGPTRSASQKLASGAEFDGPTPAAPGTQNADTGQEVAAGLDGDRNPPRPILQELKREATHNFRRWQISVTRRVGDISAKSTRRPGDRGRFPKRAASGNQNSANQQFATKTCMTPEDETMRRFYPPVPTTLSYLPMERKILVLHAMLLLLISLDHYNAYSRIFLLSMTSSLHVPMHVLLDDEVNLAHVLAEGIKEAEPADMLRRRPEEAKPPKKWKPGMMGLTAGSTPYPTSGRLAASLVASGVGTIPSGLDIGSSAALGIMGSMSESGFSVGTLFGICSVRMTGKAMEQYAKDVADFAFQPLHDSKGNVTEIGKICPQQRRLRAVLCIGGWLTEPGDVIAPWRILGDRSEVYAIRWETEALSKLGSALQTVSKSAAWSNAKREIATRRTRESPSLHKPSPPNGKVSSSCNSSTESTWPAGLLKISKAIDNPWIVGMVRADKAGTALAEMIINKLHGERGITLIGYSLGARVVYTCLMSLAEKRAFGLVENAILMGAPAPSELLVWGTMRSAVSNRLVNVYSESDYILGFLYRTGSTQYGVAGVCRIVGVNGVENVNVTAKIGGHMRYQHLVGSILSRIGWEDIRTDAVAANEKALALLEDKNRARDRKRDAVELCLDGTSSEAQARGQAPCEQPGIIRTRIKRKGRNRK